MSAPVFGREPSRPLPPHDDDEPTQEIDLTDKPDAPGSLDDDPDGTVADAPAARGVEPERGADAAAARGDEPEPAADAAAARGDEPEPDADAATARGEEPEPGAVGSGSDADAAAARGDEPEPAADAAAARGDEPEPDADASAARGDEPEPGADEPEPDADTAAAFGDELGPEADATAAFGDEPEPGAGEPEAMEASSDDPQPIEAEPVERSWPDVPEVTEAAPAVVVGAAEPTGAESQWFELQALFVDDPTAATAGALRVLREELDGLSPAGASTEDLRAAFRRYRAAYHDLVRGQN